MSINSFNKVNIQLYLNDLNTFKFSRLVALPLFFFLYMAFQFVAFDHSFSTLVVVPLFFLNMAFQFMAFQFMAFHHSFSTFVALQLFSLNMAFLFCGFEHSFTTLVALPLFFSIWLFILWPLTIHSQHWWPFQKKISQHGLSFVAFDHSFSTLVAMIFLAIVKSVL